MLLDEVFEVGDEDFRNKSASKIKELTRDGACVIFVSHELERIEKYCDRVIWLENGEIKQIGNPEEIVEKYRKE